MRRLRWLWLLIELATVCPTLCPEDTPRKKRPRKQSRFCTVNQPSSLRNYIYPCGLCQRCLSWQPAPYRRHGYGDVAALEKTRGYRKVTGLNICYMGEPNSIFISAEETPLRFGPPCVCPNFDPDGSEC